MIVTLQFILIVVLIKFKILSRQKKKNENPQRQIVYRIIGLAKPSEKYELHFLLFSIFVNRNTISLMAFDRSKFVVCVQNIRMEKTQRRKTESSINRFIEAFSRSQKS